MELKDYVSETIVQICEGITDAMKKLEGSGVIINLTLHFIPMDSFGLVSKKTMARLSDGFKWWR